MEDRNRYLRQFISESTKRHRVAVEKRPGGFRGEFREPSVVLRPGDMVSIFDRDPEIYLELKNDSVVILSASGYLDEDWVVSEVEGSRVMLHPQCPLSTGEHWVRVEINKDTQYERILEWGFVVEKKDGVYNHYFGVPHAHTSYSDGRGTPLEACEYVRSRGLNYFITADHSNQLDGVMEDNYEYDPELNEYLEVPGSSWYKTRLEVEEINSRYQDFLALRGFEMSSSLWGHINVIGSSTYVEAKSQMSRMEDFLSWLKGKRGIAVVINHPYKHFKYWNYDRELDRIVSLVEVANGAPPRKYRRMEEYYFKMLDMGWHFGAVNGQDNHRANWGDRDTLTVILSEGLTKDSFLSAMKRRRTYSTETRSLKLTLRAKGHWMGSIIEAEGGERVRLEIAAEDNEAPIKKLEVISRGGRVIMEKSFKEAKKIEWTPEVEAHDREEWYVVRVVHSDGRWGISSPVFIRGV